MLYLCMLVASTARPSTPSGVTVVPPAPQADTQPAEPAVTYDQGHCGLKSWPCSTRYFFLEKTAGTRESERACRCFARRNREHGTRREYHLH